MTIICGGTCGRTLGDEPIFAHTTHGPRFCRPCWQVENADEIAEEAKCDRWHDGYFSKERPTDPDELEGWLQAREDAKLTVVMPVRPEGYYHAPLGTFE